MKRKVNIKIVPSFCTPSGVNVYIETVRKVPVSGIEYDWFILKSKNMTIHQPVVCIEDLPGHYELIFPEGGMDKIRIKKYGWSTEFVKLSYRKKEDN